MTKKFKEKFDNMYDEHLSKNIHQWYLNPLSIQIVEKKYLHQGEHSPKDMIYRVCSIMSNERLALRLAELMLDGSFFPAGRTLYGAGSKGKFNATLSNCYVVPSVNDSLDDIYESNKQIAKIFKSGGGIGINLSNLRPNGSKTNNAARTSTGAVSFIHLYNTTGAIIGFHGRRGATLVGLNINHPDIEEFVELRSKYDLKAMNISCVIDDAFMEAVETDLPYELSFVVKETGEEIHKTIMAKELFHKICQMNWDYGDPGMLFKNTIDEHNFMSTNKEFKIDICNPCLAGYTRILTDKGYLPIESLVGQEVNIWNGYRFSKVVPRVTGHDQKMVRVTFSNGSIIDCTLYHKFIMKDGSRKEAKDLAIGDKLTRWYLVPIEGYKDVDRKIMYTHGFYSGDGNSTNYGNYITLYGPKKNLLEVFNYLMQHEQASTNTSGESRISIRLIEDNVVPYDKNWVPDASFTIDSRLWWLSGLIDSDGTLNSQEGCLSISSINYGFLHDVQLMLNTLGVQSTIVLLREAGLKQMPANNGTGEYKEYYCQTCYRLLISAGSVIQLLRLGLQTFRVRTLPTTLGGASRYVKVVGIQAIPDARTVYCLTEPYNHSLIAEGVLVSNCAEFGGPAYSSCNLGSMNLYNYVDRNSSIMGGAFNYGRFYEDVQTAVEVLDEVLDYGYELQPLDENREVIDKWRPIGLGFFGFADALVGLHIKYGSPESIKFAKTVCSTMLNAAVEKSIRLGWKKDSFKCFDKKAFEESEMFKLLDKETKQTWSKSGGFMRNAQLLSIAPTGSLALLAGQLSSGIEPIFKCVYERSTHSLEDNNISFTVADKAIEDLLLYDPLYSPSIGHGNNPSSEYIKKTYPFVVEAKDIDPIDRVEVQAAMQEYIDNAISSTVNLPESATVEDIENIYMTAWRCGLKGITVFRDNCKRASILGFSSKKEEKQPASDVKDDKIIMDKLLPIPRRTTGPLNGRTYRKSTACVRALYVTVNRDENDNIFEVFTNKSIHGCSANIATITRLVSLALRSGISVPYIIKELKENTCQACQVAIKKDKSISLSCPIAIAEALEEEYNRYTSKKEEGSSKPTTTTNEAQDGQFLNISDMVCPECKERTLIYEGRCVTCKKCGYSKCD